MSESIVVFDPGGTTGYCQLERDRCSTDALTPAQVEDTVTAMWQYHGAVVIEKGPRNGGHSPITRKLEALLIDAFPDAVLVQPSQWKNHPAATCEKRATQHERDAECIARWFYAKEHNGRHYTPRTDEGRSRHLSDRAGDVQDL